MARSSDRFGWLSAGLAGSGRKKTVCSLAAKWRKLPLLVVGLPTAIDAKRTCRYAAPHRSRYGEYDCYRWCCVDM